MIAPRDLTRLFANALRTLDGAECVERALVSTKTWGRGLGPLRVVAIGKAAPPMAAGAIARWGREIERCLVVAPDDTSVERLVTAAARAGIDDRVEVRRAAHPVPDARSVKAGRACLRAVSSATPRRILVLVSGGASALICAPSEGITLRTKCAITSALLASGCSIQELNVVRKHLSRIKGGGLSRAAGPNPVWTFIASDVIGGSPGDVGSGPSVIDSSSVMEARRVLSRYAPAFADVKLSRSFSRGNAERLHAKVVQSPEALARAAARLLRARGLLVRVLPPSQGRVEDMAADYLARAAGSPRVYVRVAEPSVVVPSHARAGRGGRSTHLAALVGRALHEVRRRVTFAAFASDGVDGVSGTGGAIVNEHFAARVFRQCGPAALDRALEDFDAGSLHLAIGTAVLRRPTGQNLADLHVLVVE